LLLLQHDDEEEGGEEEGEEEVAPGGGTGENLRTGRDDPSRPVLLAGPSEATMADPIRYALTGGAAPGFGFTFDAPGFPAPDGQAPDAQLVLVGPGQGGFAPNLNVIVQEIETTPDAYVEDSVLQFGEAGYRVNAMVKTTVSGREAVIIDYEGVQGGMALRWNAMAVFDAKRVILATCTVRREEFAAHEKAMKACLESFRLSGPA
jgi:hypothetical protein